MDEEQREAARRRYNLRCGYRGVHEEDAGAVLTKITTARAFRAGVTSKAISFTAVQSATSTKVPTGMRSIRPTSPCYIQAGMIWLLTCLKALRVGFPARRQKENSSLSDCG